MAKEKSETERAREYQKTIKSKYRKEGAEDFLFYLWQKNCIDQSTWEIFVEKLAEWKKGK